MVFLSMHCKVVLVFQKVDVLKMLPGKNNPSESILSGISQRYVGMFCFLI